MKAYKIHLAQDGRTFTIIAEQMIVNNSGIVFVTSDRTIVGFAPLQAIVYLDTKNLEVPEFPADKLG